MDQVRLGLIGAGFMGGVHARIGAEMPGVEIVAVADIDERRARSIAASYGGQAYADYRDMLAKERIDAVIITTPETDHRSPVVAAAEAGCHVFLEKPLAATLEDADTIIKACQQAQVRLMIGYILRFEPCYARIYEAVTRGEIGAFLSAYARRNATIEEGRRLGGRTSVINYLAVHDIDQFLWYRPGYEVRKVFAKQIKGRLMEEVGVPDFSWLVLEFDDGALGVVECGWALTEGWKGFSDVKLNVIGTHGVLNLDFNPMNLTQVTAENGWTFPETRHWPVVNERLAGAALLEVEHFIDCVRQNREPLVDGLAGRRSLEVALAAERSILEEREVALPF
jgi:UDP-N-acetylglucosamine 3-dehydrogenase